MKFKIALIAGVIALAGCQQEEVMFTPMILDGSVTVDGVEYTRKARETNGFREYFVVVNGRTFMCENADCVKAVARGLRAEENDDDGDDY